MPRKVILDIDPGIGDAFGLAIALATPELEVVAVTATGGMVTPLQATHNVQALLEQLDPPRWPRIGAACPDQPLRTDDQQLGEAMLCGPQFAVTELANRHLSLKVLGDEIRQAPGEVTIVTTGPLSNIADLVRYEPDLSSQIGHLIMLGGSLSLGGNATSVAEFNIYSDAESARQVFQSPITKTLVPLDVTSQWVLKYEFLDRVQQFESRTATLLQQILPGAYRTYRQHLGMEGMYAAEVVAVALAAHPYLFTTEPMHGDVETTGELTYGATVFDQRSWCKPPPNMEVALEMDPAGVERYLHQVLEAAP